jgi:hypothetical protein
MRASFAALLALCVAQDDDGVGDVSSSIILNNDSVVPRVPVGLTAAPFPGAVKGTYLYTGVADDGGGNAYPLVAADAGRLHLEFTEDAPVKPTPNPIYSPPQLDVLCTGADCPELDAFAPEGAPPQPDDAVPVAAWLPPSCNPAINPATAACGAALRECLAAKSLSQCDARHSSGQTLVSALLADLQFLRERSQEQGQTQRVELRNLLLESLRSDFVGLGALIGLVDRVIADNNNKDNAVADSDPKKRAEDALVEAASCWKSERFQTPLEAACGCYNAHGKCWRGAGCFDSLPKADVDHCFHYLSCTRMQCEGSGAAASTVAAAALLVAAAFVAVLL